MAEPRDDDIDAILECGKALGTFEESRAREFLDVTVARGTAMDQLAALVREARTSCDALAARCAELEGQVNAWKTATHAEELMLDEMTRERDEAWASAARLDTAVCERLEALDALAELREALTPIEEMLKRIIDLDPKQWSSMVMERPDWWQFAHSAWLQLDALRAATPATEGADG